MAKWFLMLIFPALMYLWVYYGIRNKWDKGALAFMLLLLIATSFYSGFALGYNF